MGDKVLETVLYSRVRKRAREKGWFFMRVENACERGTPDLYIEEAWDIEVLGGPLWVECKTANSPKSDSHVLTGFEIRPEQKRWHLEYLRLTDRNSYFLIQVGSGGKARRYLVPGVWLVGCASVTEGLLKGANRLGAYPIC